jgi:hypothetical protein
MSDSKVNATQAMGGRSMRTWSGSDEERAGSVVRREAARSTAKRAGSTVTMDAWHTQDSQLSPHSGGACRSLLVVSLAELVEWLGRDTGSRRQSQKPTPMFKRTSHAIQRAICRLTSIYKSAYRNLSRISASSPLKKVSCRSSDRSVTLYFVRRAVSTFEAEFHAIQTSLPAQPMDLQRAQL